MEYVYAALILNETGAEINESNLTDVLDAAKVDVEESRVKALVAALEDVDIEEAVEQAAAVPAGGAASPSDPAGLEEPDEEEEEEEPEAEGGGGDEDDDGGEGGDDEEDASGEGLGELFG